MIYCNLEERNLYRDFYVYACLVSMVHRGAPLSPGGLDRCYAYSVFERLSFISTCDKYAYPSSKK
jgi:hypothetical protein